MLEERVSGLESRAQPKTFHFGKVGEDQTVSPYNFFGTMLLFSHFSQTKTPLLVFQQRPQRFASIAGQVLLFFGIVPLTEKFWKNFQEFFRDFFRTLRFVRFSVREECFPSLEDDLFVVFLSFATDEFSQ